MYVGLTHLAWRWFYKTVSCIKIVLIDFAYKRFNCLLSLLLQLLLFVIILLLVLLIVDIISLLLLNASRVNRAQIREESTLLETARGRYRQGLLGTGTRAGVRRQITVMEKIVLCLFQYIWTEPFRLRWVLPFLRRRRSWKTLHSRTNKKHRVQMEIQTVLQHCPRLLLDMCNLRLASGFLC